MLTTGIIIIRHLLSAADGFVIVYSVEDPHSYQVAEAIRRDIEKNRDKKDIVVLVLGTKIDLLDTRKVEPGQLLNDKVHVRDVSAMDRKSLYEPFMYLASRLNPQPNKSTLAKVTSTMKRDKNKDAD